MGRVAAPHGVRGAMRVQPLSEEPLALLGHAQWWLRPRAGLGEWSAYRLVKGREQSGVLVVELAGVATREAAASLRGAEVGVPREQLPALAEHEHYQADLIGMKVVNRSGEILGDVIEFQASGAHPIMRVGGEGLAQRLIPWVGQYIDRIDAPARRIEVDWPVDY